MIETSPVAIDTNILIYAEGFGPPDKVERARRVVNGLPQGGVVPVQVFGEFMRVLVHKGRWERRQADAAVANIRLFHKPVATTIAAFDAARVLSSQHNLPIWDAVILAVAAEAGCSVLLSEDGHEGFAWAGLAIVNPFSEPMHPRLSRLLS